MILGPSNDVVACATIHSAATPVAKTSLQNWVMVIEKVPPSVKVDTGAVHLFRLWIQGPARGRNGAGGTSASEKIRSNGMQIM